MPHGQESLKIVLFLCGVFYGV